MKKNYRSINIVEYFKKIDGKVYWYWKFQHDKKWNRRLTPFDEIPYVEVNFTPIEKEY